MTQLADRILLSGAGRPGLRLGFRRVACACVTSPASPGYLQSNRLAGVVDPRLLRLDQGSDNPPHQAYRSVPGSRPWAALQRPQPHLRVWEKAPTPRHRDCNRIEACLREGGGSARRRRSCDCNTVTPAGGAPDYGRTEEKNDPVAAGNAPQPRGLAARGACGVPELRRAEAAASCVQPLRLLRWARGGCRRQEDAEGRGSRLTRGARAISG
jgi:hypothetical protein